MRRPREIIKGVVGTIRYYIRGLYRRYSEEEVLFLSSGIAFNAILCLIPLLLLVTFTVGMILQGSHSTMHKQINDILDSVMPSEQYAKQIRIAIEGMIDDIIRYRSTFGISGVIAFLWTATSLFSSVRTVLNRIYRITARKFALRRMIENVILVILLTVLFFTANMFTWLLQLIDSTIREIPTFEQFRLNAYIKTIPSGLEYLPALAMFYIVNRFIPDRSVGSRVALVSAITSTSLWWVAGRAFAWYLAAFHSYSKLYGTYAFVLVFLMWIYYSSVVFIIGTIIGDLYKDRRPLSLHK